MSETAVLRSLVDRLCDSGRITADDVLALRREVFPDGVVSSAEAQSVFRLDEACAEKCPEWTRFYVDALTDYFVWQSEPRGYVDAARARELLDAVHRDGRIDALSELELLLNVVHWCVDCPAELSRAALDAVKESVLRPSGAPFGAGREPAVITAEDVELIRKLIYAPGSPGGITVTLEEAELLFALDRETESEKNAETWPDLFAKAVASAVMFPRGAPRVPDAAEVLRRERELEGGHGIGGLLTGIGKAVAGGDLRFRGAYEEADVFGRERAEDARERAEAAAEEAFSRETVTSAEVTWLAEQLERDARISPAERQLLAFIKENSPSVDPALDPYFEKAGL
jgi:hypothetical protein